jgi:hypothetical protein
LTSSPAQNAPGAGQHDDAHAVVGLGVAQRVDHLVVSFDGGGIHRMRPIDRDGRDAVALVVENVVVWHGDNSGLNLFQRSTIELSQIA